MAVRLNRTGYEHARALIADGQFVADERDAWSEHQPTARQETEFLEKHGIGEYRRWYLGVDDEQPEDRKARYRFPYGDFVRVHRCGVLSAEVRAAQYDHEDIRAAAAHLHGMLDGATARRR
jgi:hypothetical protein